MGSVLNSQFVKGICCEHKWLTTGGDEDLWKQQCAECKATCVRDRSTGAIIEYDRTVGFKQDEREDVEPRGDRPPQRRDNKRNGRRPDGSSFTR